MSLCIGTSNASATAALMTGIGGTSANIASRAGTAASKGAGSQPSASGATSVQSNPDGSRTTTVMDQKGNIISTATTGSSASANGGGPGSLLDLQA